MISMTYLLLVVMLLLTFIIGGSIGAFIVYKCEERTLRTMLDQCAQLEETNKKLVNEREEYRKTRDMFAVIDDVPEYLRGKYSIPGSANSELEEVYTEIYC
jgi:hypothetical protein